MLDISVIEFAIGEDMVHIVLGRPPLKAETAEQAWHDFSIFH